MKYGDKITLYELNIFNNNHLKIGDIIKNIKDNKYYIIIDMEKEIFHPRITIEVYPIQCKDYINTIEDDKEVIFNQLNLFNISDKIELKSLYKNSETLNHCDFDEYSDDEYIYIGYIPIKKVLYIEIDN